MTKSAQKEPSMDEILSSIRQIIAADDAAAAAPRRPALQPAAVQPRATSLLREQDYADVLEDREPLALSPSQMINRPQPTTGAGISNFDAMLDTAVDDREREFVETGLVDPDDIAFADDEDDEAPAMAPPPRRYYPTEPMASFAPAPELTAAAPAEEPATAPLPHAQMSADLTDQLIEPVTQAAVRGSMNKLNGLSIGTPGLTIEAMVRDMLRPMLKQWLDENLPAVVERMVEKEIARVSRGE